MEDRSLVSLSDRLDCLEKENGVLRLFGFALLLLLGCVLLAAPSARPGSPADEVVAQRFVLRDSQGVQRASLGMDEFDFARLSLYDQVGKQLLTLEAMPFGFPRLTLSYRGTNRLGLFLWEDGSPHIGLYDSLGRTRAAIGMEDESAFLAFLDEDQFVIRELPVDIAAHPALDCRPTTLTPGDTLVISMTTPHPGNIGIRSPSGHWYYIVHPDIGTGYDSQMDPAEFAQLPELKIITDRAMAKRYVYGARELELIFGQPGDYVIRMGENLWAEDWPYYDCLVRYDLAR